MWPGLVCALGEEILLRLFREVLPKRLYIIVHIGSGSFCSIH